METAFPIRFAGSWLALWMLVWPARVTAQTLREYDTPYYLIYTDLDAEDAREAVIRTTRMFEEYRSRTQGFSGEIQKQFPIYLYKNREDYLKAGGLPGSAGIFSGSVLMATAGGAVTPRTWYVVQHEGFHQFAKAVIRGNLPAWLNEGLAEYFGQSLFTGDSFFSGLIPPKRLARLKAAIEEHRLKGLKELMALNHDQWNQKLEGENYDQAWSIVHFLVLANDARYQPEFVRFITGLGTGLPAARAWQQSKLPEPGALERQWREWWLAQPPDPTADQYAQAYAQTFASYLARAASQRQRFNTFQVFAAAVEAGTVRSASARKSDADLWLPPRLLKDAMDVATTSAVRWSIQQMSNGRRRVVADCPDGVHITAECVLRAGEPAAVSSDFDDTALVVQRARGLIAAGKRAEARTILQAAIKNHKDSPSVPAALQLLHQTQ